MPPPEKAWVPPVNRLTDKLKKTTKINNIKTTSENIPMKRELKVAAPT